MMELFMVSVFVAILGIGSVEGYTYTNAFQYTSGCTGSALAATTYNGEVGHSSGCHHGMMWQWSNGKPSCSANAMKISDYLDNSAGCSGSPANPDLHWIKDDAIGDGYPPCLKFIRGAEEERSMKVYSWFDGISSFVTTIQVYDNYNCDGFDYLEFEWPMDETGEMCMTDSGDNQHHLYVKWC